MCERNGEISIALKWGCDFAYWVLLEEIWKLEEEKDALENKASTLEHSNGGVREALRTAQEDRDIAQQKAGQSSGGVGLSKGRTAALLIKKVKISVSKIMAASAPHWDLEHGNK